MATMAHRTARDTSVEKLTQWPHGASGDGRCSANNERCNCAAARQPQGGRRHQHAPCWRHPRCCHRAHSYRASPLACTVPLAGSGVSVLEYASARSYCGNGPLANYASWAWGGRGRATSARLYAAAIGEQGARAGRGGGLRNEKLWLYILPLCYCTARLTAAAASNGSACGGASGTSGAKTSACSPAPCTAVGRRGMGV